MPNNTLAQNLQRLVDAKSDIADAITTMGGTVNEGDGFEEFPADIASIPSGGALDPYTVNVNPQCNRYTQKCIKIKKSPTSYVSKSWNIDISDGSRIYNIGKDTYCDEFKLNKNTDLWEKMTSWVNLLPNDFYGKYVWSDGINIYYSFRGTNKVLDRSTNTWVDKEWFGISDRHVKSFNGDDIWMFNGIIYYSNGGAQYTLDVSTSTWSSKSWYSGSSYLTSFEGKYVWIYNGTAYYSRGSDQYTLQTNVSRWNPKTWTGLASFSGVNVWSDGTNTYYSNSSDQYQLSGSTWSVKTWTGLASFSGVNVWSDGTNTYYSNGYSQYILDKNTSTWSTVSWMGISITIQFIGEYIWSDGTNIYYSNGGTQYALSTDSSNTWVSKTWLGLGIDSFSGVNVWSDGTNTYYKFAYIWNPATNMWDDKVWYWSDTALDVQYVKNIWSDGDNVYISYGATQYVLNKTTSTWSTNSWSNSGSNLTTPISDYIWSVNSNIYHSNGANHYYLDKSLNKWVGTSFGSTLTSFNGSEVWSDGVEVYATHSGTTYVYRNGAFYSTSTQIPAPSIPSNMVPSRLWTDGDRIFYSYSSSSTKQQYQLTKAIIGEQS